MEGKKKGRNKREKRKEGKKEGRKRKKLICSMFGIFFQKNSHKEF